MTSKASSKHVGKGGAAKAATDKAKRRPGKERSARPSPPDVKPVRAVNPAPSVKPADRSVLARGPGCQIQPGQQMLFLSQASLAGLPWEKGEVLNHVQFALRDVGRGKVETSQQIVLYPQRESLLSAVAANIPNVQACGLKLFATFPNNQRLQLPQVSSLVVLTDPHTGFPISVMDAGWLVRQRGPAVSAVAARLLARATSTTATIIGAGVQGRGHIPALVDALPSLTTVWVYDIEPSQTAKAIRWARTVLSRKVHLEPASDLASAVRVADVIVSATATAARKPVGSMVPLDWIRQGALVLPLDLDSIFAADVFEQADRFYVDSRDDLKALHEKGVFLRAMPTHVTGQLGHLLAGRIEGRSADAEIIVCLNIGAGAVDIALARAAFDKACRLGVGQVLSL
jgi:ornithine cyclodeaminase/alanine dehydrogenase-like protein (mu-crystallin family)